MALVIENARLVGELTEAEAAQREFARSLQTSLRPPALPQVPGAALASFYRSVGDGADVGGDFYDAYPLGDGWLLVIGDVTGKGAAAASVTALARGAIEATATETGSTLAAIRRLDGLLQRRDDDALSSVALVHVRSTGGGMRAEVLLAGHPPVLLVRGGTVEPVGISGPLPGAFPASRWHPVAVDLRAGDVLVLRTDGATDAVGADGRLGEQRLRASLEGLVDLSAQGAVDRVRDAVLTHTVGAQRDDVAVLAIAVGGTAQTVHVELDGSPASVAAARRVVETHLGDDLRPATLARLRLLVSELAANAVRHGAEGSARLTLGWDDTVVRAAIVDQGSGFTSPSRARPRPHRWRTSPRAATASGSWRGWPSGGALTTRVERGSGSNWIATERVSSSRPRPVLARPVGTHQDAVFGGDLAPGDRAQRGQHLVREPGAVRGLQRGRRHPYDDFLLVDLLERDVRRVSGLDGDRPIQQFLDDARVRVGLQAREQIDGCRFPERDHRAAEHHRIGHHDPVGAPHERRVEEARGCSPFPRSSRPDRRPGTARGRRRETAGR